MSRTPSLRRAVVCGGGWCASGDWDGRLVSHKEMQTVREMGGQHGHWLRTLADINRFARYWLDGWDGESESNAA